MQRNYKVTWQEIGGTESRYFPTQLRAEQFADNLRALTYRTNPKVDYVGRFGVMGGDHYDSLDELYDRGY